MFFFEFLMAVLVALVLTFLLVTAGRPRSTTTGELDAAGALFLFFFLILFLATWAGGVWVTPFGPALWGVYWLPFVLVGLFVALLLAAAAAPSRYHRPISPTEQRHEAAAAATVFGAVFWILLLGLVLAIVASYLW